MATGIGFIGLGIMGNRMMTNMTAHGGFHLVCAWDPGEPACEKAKADFAGLEIAASARAVIDNPDVHIVYIASPPASHREYAMAAAEAGKAVFCEKPLGIDVAESREMVRRFEQLGTKNAVNYPLANSIAADTLKAAIDAGDLGEITGANISLHFAPWPRDWQADATWLKQRAEGGFIREVGSHWIYLSERLFGQADVINSVVLFPDDDVSCESHVQAQLVCEDIPVSLTATSGGIGPDVVQFTVWGTKTSYRINMWVDLFRADGETWQPVHPDIDDAREVSYLRGLDNLLAWYKDEPHSIASFADALSVQEAVESILSGGEDDED
ncbi:MAG: Gfo/Idh/MocA family oxidoreductase [Cohaesibacteraceae bacterium]|nr:Gfo/Idh/MocA family oxidoreductase [Cohaesibacteraceae bacterium]